MASEVRRKIPKPVEVEGEAVRRPMPKMASAGSMVRRPMPSPDADTGDAPTNAPVSRPAPPVRTVSTKGGDYPVYERGSSQATSFNQAFGDAVKAGLKTFEWNGRKYTTQKRMRKADATSGMRMAP